MHCNFFSEYLCYYAGTFQMIGAAKKCQGLFYLSKNCDLSLSKSNFTLPCSVLTNNSTPTLWHMKLGQPSNKILQILISQYTDIFLLLFLHVMLVPLLNKNGWNILLAPLNPLIFSNSFMLIYGVQFLFLPLMDTSTS